MRHYREPNMNANNTRGVTLVELLVTVTAVAILAGIAIPSYRQYMLRSQRPDATTMLLRVQSAQEKFFLQNLSYSADLAGAPPAGLGLSATSTARHYDIALAMGPANMTYVATATPRAGGGQVDDSKCTAFTVNQAGIRGATGVADAATYCWR
jgi:type IV pilus assembly protein PilE